jgi:hypothetical protein
VLDVFGYFDSAESFLGVKPNSVCCGSGAESANVLMLEQQQSASVPAQQGTDLTGRWDKVRTTTCDGGSTPSKSNC